MHAARIAACMGATNVLVASLAHFFAITMARRTNLVLAVVACGWWQSMAVQRPMARADRLFDPAARHGGMGWIGVLLATGRLRGGGLFKKMKKGMPLNMDEKRLFDMAKRGEFHTLLLPNSGKPSRRDLAVRRTKESRQSLALPRAARARSVARIAEKLKRHPQLARHSCSLTERVVPHTSGGRPDVWSAKGGARAGAKRLRSARHGQIMLDNGAAGAGTGPDTFLADTEMALNDSQGARVVGVDGGLLSGDRNVDATGDGARQVGWRFEQAKADKKRGEEAYLRRHRKAGGADCA